MPDSQPRDESSKHGWRILLWILGLTVAIEAVTCLMRFGLQFESTRDTASFISQFTFGYRIHHGYIGLLMTIAAVFAKRQRSSYKTERKDASKEANDSRRSEWWIDVVMVVGLSLLTSDIIHHFVVLWPITGSPQFDLFYPPR